eukprot:9176564-Heterocapsa_arctica.AAC.1
MARRPLAQDMHKRAVRLNQKVMRIQYFPPTDAEKFPKISEPPTERIRTPIQVRLGMAIRISGGVSQVASAQIAMIELEPMLPVAGIAAAVLAVPRLRVRIRLRAPRQSVVRNVPSLAPAIPRIGSISARPPVQVPL